MNRALTTYLVAKGLICLSMGLMWWLWMEDSFTGLGLLAVSLIEFLLAAALSCYVRVSMGV